MLPLQSVRNKRSLARIFSTAFFLIIACYTVLALVLGWYFGTELGSQANIEWEYYLGCVPTLTAPSPWWADMLAFIVLVFPAADVLSAYPLFTVTLSSSLIALFGLETPLVTARPKEEEEEALSHGDTAEPSVEIEMPPHARGLGQDSPRSSSDRHRSVSFHDIALGNAAGDDFVSSAERGNSRPRTPLQGSTSAAASGSPQESFLLQPTSGTATSGHPAHHSNACCGPYHRFMRCLERRHRTRKITCRLTAALPPLIGASLVFSLGSILHYTGVVAVVLAFIAPPWVWKASQKACIQVRSPCRSHCDVALTLFIAVLPLLPVVLQF